jgi:hypothetical protein
MTKDAVPTVAPKPAGGFHSACDRAPIIVFCYRTGCTSRWCPRQSGIVNSSLAFRARARAAQRVTVRDRKAACNSMAPLHRQHRLRARRATCGLRRAVLTPIGHVLVDGAEVAHVPNSFLAQCTRGPPPLSSMNSIRTPMSGGAGGEKPRVPAAFIARGERPSCGAAVNDVCSS